MAEEDISFSSILYRRDADIFIRLMRLLRPNPITCGKSRYQDPDTPTDSVALLLTAKCIKEEKARNSIENLELIYQANIYSRARLRSEGKIIDQIFTANTEQSRGWFVFKFYLYY